MFRVLGPAGVSWVGGDGVVAGGRWAPRAAAQWQSPARARASPSEGLPASARPHRRHLMAKAEEAGAVVLPGRRSPRLSAPLDGRPQAGPSSSKSGTFPRLRIPSAAAPDGVLLPPGPRRAPGAAAPASAAAGGPGGRQPASFQPRPLSGRCCCGSCSSATGSRGEGKAATRSEDSVAPRALRAPRAPGKCLNNRMDAGCSGCGKVGRCCRWGCSLGPPGAQHGRAKSRPAPSSGAAVGVPDAPLVASQHSCRAPKTPQLQPAPGSRDAPITRCCLFYFLKKKNHRLPQPPRPPPPPTPPPPAACGVRVRPK